MFESLSYFKSFIINYCIFYNKLQDINFNLGMTIKKSKGHLCSRLGVNTNQKTDREFNSP